MKFASSVYTRTAATLLLAAALIYSAPHAVAQERGRHPAGTPVLWRVHASPSSLDLY